MNYAIGLDVGVSSVGWAVVGLDQNENPCGILGMGTRMFSPAEHPKTGASLAAPRREARCQRRRLRRHKHRNERIRSLLVKCDVVTEEQLSNLLGGKLEDIYELRVRALDQLVTGPELARILIHLSQRRGFRSNRKSGVGEEGQLLSAVSENRKRMEDNGYRTVGEMFLRDAAFAEHKRNIGGNYLGTVARDQIEEEARMIFSAQRSLGSKIATEALEEAYLSILLSQRSFDEGPGGNSPYGGNIIENMVGYCTFEPGERRAAKGSYSFEYFTLLEKVNHIRLLINGNSVPLTKEQREAVIAQAHKTASLDYHKIRKLLKLDDSVRFNMVRYSDENPAEESEKKTKIDHLRCYHKIRKALGSDYEKLTQTQKDAIGEALTYYKTSDGIAKALSEFNLQPEVMEKIDTIGSFSGFGHLSIKACKKISLGLACGLNYNDACAEAGYNFKAHSNEKASFLLHPTQEDYSGITSPVAKRSISQTIKVINAIIRSRGSSPVYVNIEVSRDLAMTFDERKKAEKEFEQNRAANEKLMEQIRSDFGITNPTGQDLVKLKLFKEQDGVCAFSLKQISAEQLFTNDVEISHIVPYSVSFDDSYRNKVLVFTSESRAKGKRLPLEYLTGERAERFIAWTKANCKNRKKRQLLLKESISPEEERNFENRVLNDTRTASRFLANYLNDNLLFADSAWRQQRVMMVSSAITSHMKKRWGIGEIRADGDLHYAVNGLVVACTTRSMVQRIKRYNVWRESRYVQTDDCAFEVDPTTGEVLKKFPYPWDRFRQELDARMSSNPAQVMMDRRIPFYLENEELWSMKPLFVSRAPKRKVAGAVHKETIRSAELIEDGFVVSRRPLTALKLDKDGEIEGYLPKNRNDDRLLYEALKRRLTEYDGDGKKAFEHPFYKPKSDGTNGPEVKKVRIQERSTLNVAVHAGCAAHDRMVRIDVFHNGEGYYFVPVYVADTLKADLPDLACVAGKNHNEWKVMDDRDFLFSLYPNDMLYIKHRSNLKLTPNKNKNDHVQPLTASDGFFYFKGANIAIATIQCITHNDTYAVTNLGVKTLACMKKYTVDVLGNYHEVAREIRQKFR